MVGRTLRRTKRILQKEQVAVLDGVCYDQVGRFVSLTCCLQRDKSQSYREIQTVITTIKVVLVLEATFFNCELESTLHFLLYAEFPEVLEGNDRTNHP